MKAVRLLAIALAAYAGLVVAFESFVVITGRRQVERGVAPDEGWLVLTTRDAQGSHETVVAGVEIDGRLYVAANHWPRAWYDRAVANPEVETTRAGETTSWTATPVTGAERDLVAREYDLPWAVRLLTGFPPRSFLRLSPR